MERYVLSRVWIALAGLAMLLVASASLAASAHAAITTIPEPRYTKGTSNTWWFQYQQPTGATGYYVVFSLNGTVVDSTKGSSLASKGNISDYQTGLKSGTYYDMTATEYYYEGGYLEPGSHALSGTTMDASTRHRLHGRRRHGDLHHRPGDEP